MQGRLSAPVGGRIQAFPAATWSQEFRDAAVIGLDCIEWIYQADGAQANPVASDVGIKEILDVQQETRIAVSSICADYFMDRRLLRESGESDSEAVEHMEWLIGRATLIGCRHIVLPFVDASALKSNRQVDTLVPLMQRLGYIARKHGLELHLETDLSPADLAGLMAKIGDDAVRLTLDTGNSAAIGHDPTPELGLIGRFVGSVHVKDRRRGGSTVPLGDGDTDLGLYVSLLADLQFAGPFVLQVARGRTGEELAWTRGNREYLLALEQRSADRMGRS